MKFRSRHNSTKKAVLFFYRDVKAFHQVPLTPPALPPPPFPMFSVTCFPSRNITKNAETHPLPMRDVIIE